MNLLTKEERQALRHYASIIKTADENNEKQINMYYRVGWLSNDPLILKYLENGYQQFALNCAERILKEGQDAVYFNLCPKCKTLARTPLAKQCRECGYDWH